MQRIDYRDRSALCNIHSRPQLLGQQPPAVFKGGPPIDCGYRFIDGERILGANKTFKGFAFGLFGGVLASDRRNSFVREISFWAASHH